MKTVYLWILPVLIPSFPTGGNVDVDGIGTVQSGQPLIKMLKFDQTASVGGGEDLMQTSQVCEQVAEPTHPSTYNS